MASSPRSDGLVRVLALVGAGGFAGAILRWLIDGWLAEGWLAGGWLGGGASGTALPLGTLAANVFAAVLLGLILGEGHLARRVSAETRLLVGTGFCGSLSTYSTFAAEVASASPAVATVYVLATYGLGFAGVVAGDVLGRWST